MFRGCREILDEMTTRLRRGRTALLLLGERRLGKTSVLRRMGRVEGHLPCFFSCQGFDRESATRFYNRLANAIV